VERGGKMRVIPKMKIIKKIITIAVVLTTPIWVAPALLVIASIAAYEAMNCILWGENP
jgi:hypothetical protein